MVMPLVSTLMATNRPHLFEHAMDQFDRQDYARRTMVVDRDHGTHGAKMDRLFRRAIGDFVCVWDDDDFYACNRIEKLVQPMIDDPKLLCVGTSMIYYVDERIGKAWLYDNSKLPHSMFWMGAPAFRKSAYDQYGPWEDLKAGADLKFLRKLPKESVLDLRDDSLMVCCIHGENAAAKDPRNFHPPVWTAVEIEKLPGFYERSTNERTSEASRI